jgi:hypothetical protein
MAGYDQIIFLLVKALENDFRLRYLIDFIDAQWQCGF